MNSPIVCAWDGESFHPLKRFSKLCDQMFVIGEVYALEECKERSGTSHRHFFAALQNGWLNLPEHLAERFQTSEHLRKFCLIKAGYHDERTIVASSKAEARRIAAFIRPIDEFAIVVTSECTVTVYTAKSQSKKAMGAKDFQASKTSVLDLIDDMLGVDRGETKKAGKAA